MFETLSEALDAFDESLDIQSVHVLGSEYDTSYVLRRLDPIAYRVHFWDWLDAEGIDSDALTGEDSRVS